MLGLSLCLHALVIAPPVGATDESVLAEPAEPAPAPAPPTQPEPAPPEPAPPGPEASELASPEPPAPPPAFPSEQVETGVPPRLPPPPPPPSGAGRLVGGSFAVVLGLAATSVVFVESAREGGNPQFAAATFIPLGLTGIGVGTYLLVRGVKARNNLREWETYTSYEARPTGDGLLVAGVMSTLTGGVTLVAAGVQAAQPGGFEGPLTPTLFAVGGTGVAVGIGTLVAGAIQRKRYRAWRQSTFLSIGRMTPTIAPLLTRSASAAPGLALGPIHVHGASVGLRAAF